jgi:hypothetical protein
VLASKAWQRRILSYALAVGFLAIDPVTSDLAYAQAGRPSVRVPSSTADADRPSEATETTGRSGLAGTAPVTAGGLSYAAVSATAAANYARLPLLFESNQGQTDPQAQFLSRGQGFTVYLTGREAVLTLARPVAKSGLPGTALTRATEARPAESPTVVRMELLGAQQTPAVTQEDEQPTKTNYFPGNDPSKWRTNVANYAKVRYHDIYPGIDLVYYGNQQRLELDFVVAPGADPSGIQWRMHGVSKIRVDHGDLTMQAGEGEIRLLKPAIYQNVNGSRREIAGRYVVQDGDTIGFRVGKFDHSRPLVIDPVLAYATFLGGSHFEQNAPMLQETRGIAVDASGNVYLTGFTSTTDFPVTSNAFQKTSTTSGGYSSFISKISADGSTLVYSTYLGTSDTRAYGIAVDGNGSAYISGGTREGFPTTANAFVKTSACTPTAVNGQCMVPFLTKLSPDGSSLAYSTFLEPDVDHLEQTGAVAVDSTGHAYATGYTNATDWPTTPGSFQPSAGPLVSQGQFSAWVTKLSADGSSEAYSTYLSADTVTIGLGIAVDVNDNAYVEGVSTPRGGTFPTTANAFQPGCNFDCTFVTKLSADGSSLVYSTLFGEGTGNTYFIAVDSAGSAYITGFVDDNNGDGVPTTPGSYQPTYKVEGVNGSVNTFVSKFSPDGSSLVYSTYLGAESYGQAIALDSNDNAWVTGLTTASDFPLTSDAIVTSATGNDVFVSEISADGSTLAFSTLLTHGYPGAIALDAHKNVWTTGITQATTLPVTSNALQKTNPTANVSCSSCSPFIVEISAAAAAPAVTLSPNPLPFPNTPANTSSTALPVTLSNTGNATLTGITITLTGANPGDFATTSASTCGATLAASSACTIDISFTPQSAASFTATLSVADNAAGSPQTVTLTGTGTAPAAPIAGLAPATLPFPSTTVGSTATALTATLSNTGNATLTGIAITLTGANPSDFATTSASTCGATLAAGSTCTIAVSFTPQSAASFAATLSVADDAAGSPQTVTLTGTGTAPAAPIAGLAPATLPFPSTTVGSTATALTATLSNTGNATLTGIAITLTGANPGDFATTSASTCGTTLAAGSTCTIAVSFTPQSAASFAATLSVADDAAGSPQTTALTGAGTAAAASDFGVATATPTQTAAPGAIAQYTIDVAPLVGSFNSAITFSATGLPAGASVSFKPPTVTPGSVSAATVMSVQTATLTAANSKPGQPPSPD